MEITLDGASLRVEPVTDEGGDPGGRPRARRRSHDVVQLLEENFAGAAHLTPEAATRLVARLAPLGIAGGSVYDALVGASAAESGLPLLTRDRRATALYRALDLRVEVVG
ncbi:MAG: PIN domain-containing protein [Acidimicrobiales bacterium]